MDKSRIEKQCTVAREVVLEGVGLHTGEVCRVTIRPAEEDLGIVFLQDNVAIPASVDYVVSTSRSTSLGNENVRIQSVEHILAALAGLLVDNAEITVEGVEIPAFDGSALPICEAIRSAGIVEQSKQTNCFKVTQPIIVETGDSFIVALPAETYRVRYYMSYDHPMIGVQSAEFMAGNGQFREKIAPARTFVLYEEVEELRERKLAKGGNLENTIVVWPDRISTAFRMPAELCVHKLVDVIGDLSLAGRPLRAEVIAVKSGHTLNVDLVRRIVDLNKGERLSARH